jgi:hypothetical protein
MHYMKGIFSLGIALTLAGLLAAPAGAAGIISANAVISDTPDGADFDYTITLTNKGTDNIGTFWFAWVPGEDFMHTSPLSVTNPSGWKDRITNGGAADGFAIQWTETTAGTADITPGSSLTFKFTSADPPAQLMGNSVFYPSTPVLTSTLYQGAPFSGDSTQFAVTFAAAVPEPSSLGLGLVAVVGSLAWQRLRRRAKS